SIGSRACSTSRSRPSALEPPHVHRLEKRNAGGLELFSAAAAGYLIRDPGAWPQPRPWPDQLLVAKQELGCHFLANGLGVLGEVRHHPPDPLVEPLSCDQHRLKAERNEDIARCVADDGGHRRGAELAEAVPLDLHEQGGAGLLAQGHCAMKRLHAALHQLPEGKLRHPPSLAEDPLEPVVMRKDWVPVGGYLRVDLDEAAAGLQGRPDRVSGVLPAPRRETSVRNNAVL